MAFFVFSGCDSWTRARREGSASAARRGEQACGLRSSNSRRLHQMKKGCQIKVWPKFLPEGKNDTVYYCLYRPLFGMAAIQCNPDKGHIFVIAIIRELRIAGTLFWFEISKFRIAINREIAFIRISFIRVLLYLRKLEWRKNIGVSALHDNAKPA